MTDLTEYTWYYCKMKDGDIQMLERGSDYFLSGDVPLLNNEVKEVLAPVPSYEEWQASENYIDYLKQCISVYESKDKQATETSIAYNELLEENTKLKELLKECRSPINYALCLNLSKEEKIEFKNLLAKINQALGEDK